MISRLTAFAAVFSILAAASLTYVSAAPQAAPAAAAKSVRIVQLGRVVVSAKRLPQAAI